jgi:hypothetical protein
VEHAALALLLGDGLPAPQAAWDFLAAFDETAPPLWQGERAAVPGEGPRLQRLAQAPPKKQQRGYNNNDGKAYETCNQELHDLSNPVAAQCDRNHGSTPRLVAG